MKSGPRSGLADGLFRGAVGCYAATCALGLVTAAGHSIPRHRWVHHAMFIATASLTAGALSTALWARPLARYRPAAGLLIPAAVPLVVIPFAGSRGLRHPIIALTAAPFYVTAAHRLNGRE